jgi:hypothetical protein
VSRRLAVILIVVASLAVVVTILLLTLRNRREPPRSADVAVAPEAAPQAGEVSLFFPGPRGLLVAERRALDLEDLPLEERVALLVGALLEGPRNVGLFAALPSGIQLRDVFAGSPGDVFVDLASAQDDGAPTVGSHEEMLMVYALVDTVALNLEQVERVGLLWNGSQRPTFAGHVDTTEPLRPRVRGLVEGNLERSLEHGPRATIEAAGE